MNFYQNCADTTKRWASKIEKLCDINVPVLSSKRATEIRGSTAFIVFTITLAVFTDIFLYGVIVPVIPYAFTERMGLSEDDIQSSVSKSLAIYSVGLVVGSAVFGYVSDKMKNRRMSMLTGLIILIASTVILCLTKSIPLFMVGRAIQGLSAAVVWTVGLAVIADTAKPNQVAYLMGFPGIGMNLAIFFGPLFGGIVYQNAGYFAVFYMCFGLLAFDVILRLLMIEKRQLVHKMKKFQTSPLDSQNSEELQVREGVSEEDPEENITDTTVPAENDSPYFIRSVDTFYGHRIFPAIGLLKHSGVLIILFLSLIMSWLLTSFESTLTIHVKDLFGFNSMYAALMFLALATPSFLEPVVGKLSDKFGPRYLVTFGLLLLTPLLIILRIPDHNTTNQIVLFVALLAIVGFGIAFLFAPIMGELSNVVEAIERKNPGKFGPGRGFGQAYGWLNVFYSLGSLIGPFHSGGVFEKDGWGMMVLSLGIICAISAVPSFLFTGGNILDRFSNRKKKQQQQQESSPTHSTDITNEA